MSYEIDEHLVDHEVLGVKSQQQLDARYINVTGDTMTGGLVVQPSTDTLTALVINDKDVNNVLTVDTINNKVGIGTTGPVSKLVVTGTSHTADNQGIFEVTTGNGDTYSDKLTVGIVDDAYTWMQAVNPQENYRNLVLQPTGGNVGIGTTNPTTRLHLAGTTSSHYAQLDAGLNFYQVTRPVGTLVSAVVQNVAGNVNTGTHCYSVTYVTPIGETSVSSAPQGPYTTDTATAGQVLVTIPVSTDYRVTKRRIYRSLVGTTYNLYLLAEVADNTTTTYMDNKSDAQLGTVYAWYKPNTTNSLIQVSGNPLLLGDEYLTLLGVNAGLNIKTNGGYYSTMVGANAGKNTTTGSMNTYIGSAAGMTLTTQSANVYIGEYCGYGLKGGSNVVIGNYAANGISQTPIGSYNAIFGAMAAYSMTGNASSNTIIGAGAGTNVVGSGNVLLGVNAGQNETTSNKLYITNSNTATPLIYGLFTGTGAGLIIHSQNLAGIPLTVKGIASQSSNLQEWQNSSAGVLASVDKDGDASFASYSVGATAGIDKSVSVLDADGTTVHAMVFTKGILTSCS